MSEFTKGLEEKLKLNLDVWDEHENVLRLYQKLLNELDGIEDKTKEKSLTKEDLSAQLLGAMRVYDEVLAQEIYQKLKSMLSSKEGWDEAIENLDIKRVEELIKNL